MISKKNSKFICKRWLTTRNLLYQKHDKKVMKYSLKSHQKKKVNKTQALKKI